MRPPGLRLDQPGGVLVLIRLAAVPVFAAAERLVDHPVANSALFGPLIVLAAVYALAALAGELRGTPLASPRALACVDLLLITALVATSGGPFSQLRYAFFLLPIGAALLLRPGLTALASAVCVLLYALVALTYPDPTSVRPDALGFELTQGLFLGWMGTAATLLSSWLTRRANEIASLATSRGRLVAQALDAEDRARRRLAEALHDDALQNLLAARQLLDAGDPESAALGREGLDEGRRPDPPGGVRLHPYLLEQAGCAPRCRPSPSARGRRAGFRAEVDVDPAAEGQRDQLLFSVGRELIANAGQAQAERARPVGVRVVAGAVELTVADDGRGIDLEAVGAAQAEGHIGLASCAERAEAVGGELHLGPGAAGRGTVRACGSPPPRPSSPRRSTDLRSAWRPRRRRRRRGDPAPPAPPTMVP
jgi:two-component system NarL family sensor kinase